MSGDSEDDLLLHCYFMELNVQRTVLHHLTEYPNILQIRDCVLGH